MMRVQETQRELQAAVKAIEARAGVEIVVVIREASAAYLHVELGCALAAMTAMLMFVVYSPIVFSDLEVALLPVAAAGFAAAVTWREATLRRLLTPAKVRRSAVELGAKAAFYDKTLGLTRKHNGVLVYVSRLERDAAIEADSAVRATEGWPALAARVERALGTARTPEALGQALRELAEPLARALPRVAGDVNELADDVEVA